MDASSARSSASPAWARRFDALLASPRLPWLFVAFGVLLRMVRYLSDHALEVSEAELALNVLPRTLWDSFAPLQYDQAAPPGFLAILILAKQLLGPGEMALRAFPLLASLAALPCFVWLSRRILHPSGVSIAAGLLAVAPLAVYYGSFAKQYTSDVLLTIVLLLLAARVQERRRGALVSFALVGAGSIWFSHPAAFVLAGTGAALALAAAMRRDTAAIARLAACGFVFAASFAAFLAVGDHGTTQNQFLLGYWEAGFLPIPPRSISDLRWFIDRGIGVLEDPGAFFPAGAAAFSLLAGTVVLWRERREMLLLIASPLPFLLAASALHLYPVQSRLVLFLLPILILLIAAGADGLRREAAGTPLLGVALLVLLFLDPVASETKKLFLSPRFEDPRPLLEGLRRDARPEDPLYVYADTQYAWRYYAPRYGFDPDHVIVGKSAESVWKDDLLDVRRLQGLPRVWILFTHVHMREARRTEEDFFLFELDRVGKRVDERHAPGASLYLYDLSGASPPG